MPNHITNILFFDCSPERFEQIAVFLRGPDITKPLGTVDFNVLVPMPKELIIADGSAGETGYSAYSLYMRQAKGLDPEAAAKLEESCKAKLADPEAWDLGKRYYENLEKYGAKTWYDWSIENWGTKWNAYDCEPIDFSEQRITFHTAWTSVPKIVEKIAERFPDAEIGYAWADEDIGHNVGMSIYAEGKYLDSKIPAGGSAEAYELAADIMGFSLADMGFIPTRDGTSYEFNMDAAEGKVEERPITQGDAR